MNNLIKKIGFCLSVILLMPSCRNEMPNIVDPQQTDGIFKNDYYWSDLFEVFWNGMNHNYVFWEATPMDWDQVYDTYMPQFEALKFNETDNKKGIDLFKEICNELIDCHYKLTLKDFNYSMLTYDHKATYRPNYHPRDFYGFHKLMYEMIRERESESTHYQQMTATPDGIHFEFLVQSYLYKGIACLHFNKFDFTGMMEKDKNNYDGICKFMNNFHQLATSNECKAIIFDLRNNPGGLINDISFIFSPFLKKGKSIPFGYIKYKNGMGRLDFSPYIPAILHGNGDRDHNEKPVVVLFDMYSFSCAEVSSMLCKQLFKDVTYIGERSAGAQGILTDEYYFSGGQFNTPNINVYTASALLVGMDKVLREGVGLDPDIEMFYDNESLQKGIDIHFNKACEVLLQKMK